MPGLGDIVQKAFYLGVGIADYAAERARVGLQELRSQAQKLADEMVARGEMSVEEARKFVDDMLIQAQQEQVTQQPPPSPAEVRQPRPIEIVVEEADSPPPSENIDDLRTQVEALEEELRRLK